MSGPLVPLGPGEAELIEKRSRFLARVIPAYKEEEALELIQSLRKRHSDATHNVYSYKIRDGGAMRYSDDGEPSGTAGMPVLDVFRKSGVGDFCCVVTRWFGGTLLGTGGLVRAYSQAARLALEAAGVGELVEYSAYLLPCPYPLADRLRYAVESLAVVDRVSYGECVELITLVQSEREEEFTQLIAEVSSGGVSPVFQGHRRTARPVSLASQDFDLKL